MLGDKIKSRRKALGLTQSDLAGEKITRNMLSCIEGGSATPSLDTLKYIAERLSLPVSYLVADECDEETYLRLSVMPKIKEAFKSEDYGYVIKLSEEVESIDDELALMLATSYYQLGKRKALSGALKSGVIHLQKALEYSDRTMYDTSKLRYAVPLYLAVCRNIQSPLLEFNDGEFLSSFNDAFEIEFYNYMMLNSSYHYINTAFSRHIEAKGLIAKYNYKDALDILLPLIDEIKKQGYNAYMMLGVYIDVENCYRQSRDFENAYRYARKRLSMTESFNS